MKCAVDLQASVVIWVKARVLFAATFSVCCNNVRKKLEIFGLAFIYVIATNHSDLVQTLFFFRLDVELMLVVQF